MRILKVQSRLLRLRRSSFAENDACDDLQAVCNAMLHLLQQAFPCVVEAPPSPVRRRATRLHRFSALAGLLARSSGWKLVYSDGLAEIFDRTDRAWPQVGP